MKTINLALCIAAIVIASCNNNTANRDSSSQTDTTTVTSATTNAGGTSAAPATQIDPAKVDNLNCPVCRKRLVTCTDTTTYQDKLIGFDSRQCDDDFIQNPGSYPVQFK